MRKFRSWAPAIGLVSLSGIVLIANPAMTLGESLKHPPGPKVTVINTRDQAVPTSIVDGMINAQVSGTVDVGNLPAVQEVRGVVSVDGQPAPKEPFQKDVSTVPFPPNNQIFVNTFTVPSGKRLVIESVSAIATLSPDVMPRMVSIGTIMGGSLAQHVVPLARLGGDGEADFFTAAYATRAYADADTVVRIYVELSKPQATPFANNHVTISGYLVDTP